MRFRERKPLVPKRFIIFLNENLRLSKKGFYLYSPVSIIAVPLAMSEDTYKNHWLIGTVVGFLLTLAIFAI
jgi:hypothetical protein